jgi:hypothetical protein
MREQRHSTAVQGKPLYSIVPGRRTRYDANGLVWVWVEVEGPLYVKCTGARERRVKKMKSPCSHRAIVQVQG